MTPWITETGCRACGSPFDPVLDLGPMVLSSFLDPAAADPPTVPLDLVICARCDLVQLRHTVRPDLLYTQYGYWYQSGINETMRAELRDVVQHVERVVGTLTPQDWVLDIGANDGTLLASYREGYHGPRGIAVEPAREFTGRLDRVRQIRRVLPGYFPEVTADLAPKSIRAITSIACFYNTPHPIAAVAEVDRLLRNDGIWIVQMQDLGQMVAATAYDNICAEHLCTYTPETFAALLVGFDLRVASIDRRPINGGSLRFGVRRQQIAGSCPMPPSPTRDDLDRFAWRVGQYRDQLRGTLEQIRAQGMAIDLYGASTKASTLLQYCGIDQRIIRQAVERTAGKVGKVTSGTRIPIVSEETWRADPSPATLLGIWQFREAVLDREAAYLAAGGSLVIPLPRMEVVCGAAGALNGGSQS